MMSLNSGGAPPSDNPILNAYEAFQRDTPIVTRGLMTTQAGAWVLSFFIDLTFGLANIPYFTIAKYEFYRIVTSLFICTSFLSLVFAYFSFVETGKRLELSMGSTEFACLLLTIGVFVNILHIAAAAFLDALIGGQYWFLLPSFGIWIILFGVVAMECTKAPQGSMRKVFVFTVPTIYYPLALLGIFSLLGGFSLAHLISIGVGYAFGYGYLDRLKVSSTRCRQWEESFPENLTHQNGWVLANAALGSGAWNEELTSMTSSVGSPSGGLNSLMARFSSQGAQQQSMDSSSQGGAGVAMGSEDSMSGRPTKPAQPGVTTEAFPSSNLPTTGGRQLGGPSRRPNPDPRQARLMAIERRMGASTDQVPVK